MNKDKVKELLIELDKMIQPHCWWCRENKGSCSGSCEVYDWRKMIDKIIEEIEKD